MDDQLFTDVIGTSGKSIKWERLLFFFAALFVGDLVWLELGPNVHHSANTGWEVSFFNIPDPGGWVLTILANVVLTLVVFAAFRLAPNAIVALLIIVIAYPPLAFANRTLVFALTFGIESFPRFTEVARSLINSFAYALFFVGGLVLALRLIKHLLLALLLGATVGTVISQFVFLFSWFLLPTQFGSPSSQVRDFLYQLLSQLAMMPFAALSGVLFAVTLWLALRLTRPRAESVPEVRLRKSFYAGTWCVAAGITMVLLVNMVLLTALGTWRTTSRYGRPRLLGLGEDTIAIMLVFAFAMVMAVVASVVFVVLVYKMWAAIQDGHARTTPGRAAGFLFIPFFNLYWAFQALWGFAKDYNSFIERQGLSLRRLPAGLFLAYIILCLMAWIPFLGWFSVAANLVVGTLMIAKICDAVNALPGGAEPPAMNQAIAA